MTLAHATAPLPRVHLVEASSRPVKADRAEDAYRHLASAVLGYLRAQGVAEPEDLLGEVFLSVARDIGRFRGDDGALRRWVFTIAHHRVVDARRRRAARPVVASAEVPDAGVYDLHPSLDPDLHAALMKLTPLQREVVVLRFVADLGTADVARIVGKREGAVKAAQSRALDQLAALLDPLA